MKIFLNDYNQETIEKAESILFNGNGFVGLRGNLEEDYYNHFATNRETYLNGFYESKTINYPEKMFGFTPSGETMISVIDGQTTLITIGGERFSIMTGTISQSSRYLDMTKGITVRKLVWTSPAGLKTKIKISRLTSFVYKNIFAMKIEFERLNHNAEITLSTHLNFHPIRTIDKNDPRMSHETQSIQVEEIDLPNKTCTFTTLTSQLKAQLQWQINSQLEQTIQEKRIVLNSILTTDSYEKKLSYAFADENHTGIEKNFDELLALQTTYLVDFWRTAKVEIASEENLEESVNYGTYALLQSLGTNGTTSIAAKGLSGSGYEGHVFWDAEMYVFPVFLHLQPQLAKSHLNFRYQTLEKARANRQLFGYSQGALYPWRTISGSESSPFFEGGSAQHHINSDIAYAFINYYRYTDDLDFMKEAGFEVLLETARVFTEIGYEKAGSFHLDKVTGPDEYTVLVNDNYYTNKMVAYQFEWIGILAQIIAKDDPKCWEQLVAKLNVTSKELEQIQRYSRNMALPFDKEQGIIAQDREFLNKSGWPYNPETTKHPLLLNYHPLTIYRYQISKQADAVFALMLFQNQFTTETIQRSVTYYDQITTHDSSLSYSIFSAVYSRLGDMEKGYEYFLKNARTDLDNLHKNTKDGIHTAAMGGTFMAILYGFCNLQIKDNALTLDPHLPAEIQSIAFTTQFKNECYRVEVNHKSHTIQKVTS
ncbi:alpha,alpha-trehalose phosphorylase [Enterococcus sp. AZ194]|uniref:glycoside hydrolase family 65 protein n=1 Tax=Enterococcus sp. AZ194 TaxID=2774629 RepID=UPI003F2790C3